MNLKTLFSLLLVSFIFISCEKDIEFNGEITNPLVVVNSFITPDSTVSAYVCVSRFFLKDSTDFYSVNNAEVNLWVNGVLKEKMVSASNGIYKATYKPVIADQIKLTVNVPQMQPVSSTTYFPDTPDILSVDTQKIITKKEVLWDLSGDTLVVKCSYKVNCKLKFTDNGNQKNYYRLIVRKVSFESVRNDKTNKVDTLVDQINYGAFDFTDVVSGNTTDPLADDGTSPVGVLLSNANNRYHVFSDDIFNGKTYTLLFNVNITKNVSKYAWNSLSDVKHEVYICLQSISKDYYLYLKTRDASSASNFFSEPVKVHNNIDGGIGILGSYTSSNVVEFELQ